MKKAIFYCFGIFSLALIISACTKEENKPKTEAPIKKTSISSEDKARTVVRRIWFDNGNPNGQSDIDYGCRDIGGSCVQEVVLTPLLRADIRGIGLVILHGSQIDVIGEFTRKKEILTPLVGYDNVEGVIHGSFITEIRGLDGECMFMIFKNKKNSKIIAVYPMM